MAKILVTPVAASEFEPFEVEGTLTSKYFPDDGLIYYINGSSYPAEIVTMLEDDYRQSTNLHPIFDDICKSFLGRN